MFLSRDLPRVALYRDGNFTLVRDRFATDVLNTCQTPEDGNDADIAGCLPGARAAGAVLPAPKRFQWVVLLIGSYAFYAFVCLRYMGFIVITTLTTYFGARGMDAMTARMEQTVAAHKQDWEREERKAYKKRCKSSRKALMIGILLFNFGILAVLKYYNFFAESMEALFASMGLTVSLGHIGLLLPLGISFYTFQSMGYVLDVYREKVPAERNVGKLALFVSFFPQIIQGPIGVYDQLAHQLYDEHKYNFDNIRYGAELILWGFFKKPVIADRAVSMIHTVAGAYTDYAGTYVLLAALVYALQLYADFRRH